LAKASGIETPTREDLAKLDRKRTNKASNKDWEHPHDPDAEITKMKDGPTHLAIKTEHAVDMDSQAIADALLIDHQQAQTVQAGRRQQTSNTRLSWRRMAWSQARMNRRRP